VRTLFPCSAQVRLRLAAGRSALRAVAATLTTRGAALGFSVSAAPEPQVRVVYTSVCGAQRRGTAKNDNHGARFTEMCPYCAC
jgi:hypothetical protein